MIAVVPATLHGALLAFHASPMLHPARRYSVPVPTTRNTFEKGRRNSGGWSEHPSLPSRAQASADDVSGTGDALKASAARHRPPLKVMSAISSSFGDVCYTLSAVCTMHIRETLCTVYLDDRSRL